MFELVSDQSRTLLGRTARKVQTDLNQVYAALGDFLVDRSPSISELLHPGMN
jgi:ABC-type transporter Mla subunit MlaD